MYKTIDKGGERDWKRHHVILYVLIRAYTDAAGFARTERQHNGNGMSMGYIRLYKGYSNLGRGCTCCVGTSHFVQRKCERESFITDFFLAEDDL